ncbi:MAG TPA: helix-turn-helix domain-containing protein [Chitinophaga sp.]
MKEKDSPKAGRKNTYQCKGGLPAISDALYVIGGKWKIPIIAALADGALRFTELQKSVNGISARVLSTELKELELNGFICKKVLVGYPVVIQYELAPYSSTLKKVVSSLSEWGYQHRKKIMKDHSSKKSSKA